MKDSGRCFVAHSKFKALVHYVVNQCKDNPERLGAIRLNKALWFIDVYSYQKEGFSVSGERYVKRERGPVPAKILATLGELQREGKLVIEDPKFLYEPRRYISKVNPDLTLLSEEDRHLARAVVDWVCGKTANEISELTHEQVWQSAVEGEEIPLYATLVSGKGAVTQEVKNWALSVVRDIERAPA